MRERIVGVGVMLAMACAAILAIFLWGDDTPFSSAQVTGIAVLTLLASLPLVDSVLFGRNVRPETAGVVLGLACGFFARQTTVSQDLSAGAERVLTTAFVLSIVLAGLRWFRSR